MQSKNTIKQLQATRLMKYNNINKSIYLNFVCFDLSSICGNNNLNSKVNKPKFQKYKNEQRKILVEYVLEGANITLKTYITELSYL